MIGGIKSDSMIYTSFSGEEVRIPLEARKLLHSAGGSSLVPWKSSATALSGKQI
jgi:hypothetical protein